MRHYPDANRHNFWAETIILGDNNITEFPTKQTFLGFPYLTNVDLSGNPLDCHLYVELNISMTFDACTYGKNLFKSIVKS